MATQPSNAPAPAPPARRVPEDSDAGGKMQNEGDNIPGGAETDAPPPLPGQPNPAPDRPDLPERPGPDDDPDDATPGEDGATPPPHPRQAAAGSLGLFTAAQRGAFGAAPRRR